MGNKKSRKEKDEPTPIIFKAKHSEMYEIDNSVISDDVEEELHRRKREHHEALESLRKPLPKEYWHNLKTEEEKRLTSGKIFTYFLAVIIIAIIIGWGACMAFPSDFGRLTGCTGECRTCEGITKSIFNIKQTNASSIASVEPNTLENLGVYNVTSKPVDSVGCGKVGQVCCTYYQINGTDMEKKERWTAPLIVCHQIRE